MKRAFRKVTGRRVSMVSYSRVYAILECGHEIPYKEKNFPTIGRLVNCRECAIKATRETGGAA